MDMLSLIMLVEQQPRHPVTYHMKSGEDDIVECAKCAKRFLDAPARMPAEILAVLERSSLDPCNAGLSCDICGERTEVQ